MDHREAQRTHAVDRYLLNQLDEADRESFEDHFFACGDCADQLRLGVVFLANAKAILSPEEFQPTALAGLEPRWAGWLGWWRSAPQWALAAATGLLAVFSASTGVLYYLYTDQGTALEQALAPRPVFSFALKPETRGMAPVLAVPAGASVEFVLDLPSIDSAALRYLCRFSSETGRPPADVTVNPPAANEVSLRLQVPVERLPAGENRISIHEVFASGRVEPLVEYAFELPRR